MALGLRQMPAARSDGREAQAGSAARTGSVVLDPHVHDVGRRETERNGSGADPERVSKLEIILAIVDANHGPSTIRICAGFLLSK